MNAYYDKTYSESVKNYTLDMSLKTQFDLSLQNLRDLSWYGGIRRLIEILLCLLAFLPLMIALPIIWFSNKIFSPGPLFYTQSRVGLEGQHLLVLKFRSMIVEAETEGAVWAAEDDSRITTVGHFIRRTHLDELPQVWNILKGEMSLIGPRPERPEFVAQLSEAIPDYEMRHMIRPGLTGWAQVNYRYGASVAEAEIKLAHDLYYIEHQNWRLDLKILIRTVGTVLQYNGR